MLETILLVDDAPAARSMTVRVLQVDTIPTPTKTDVSERVRHLFHSMEPCVLLQDWKL